MDAPNARDEASIEDIPPPAYSEAYGLVDISQDGFETQASVTSMLSTR